MSEDYGSMAGMPRCDREYLTDDSTDGSKQMTKEECATDAIDFRARPVEDNLTMGGWVPGSAPTGVHGPVPAFLRATNDAD